MGLDFSHGNAHWSYSGFYEFRKRLLKSIGIDLKDMKHFGGSAPWSSISDPLVYLIDHSDCDGKLSPEECKVIYPRLREIVSNWKDWDEDNDEGYDKVQALMLAEGMEEASKLGVPLIFC